MIKHTSFNSRLGASVITVEQLCEAAPGVFAQGEATEQSVTFDLDDWAFAMARAAERRPMAAPLRADDCLTV